MNMEEAVLALENKDDAKAIAAIEFLTSHLQTSSSCWRDLVLTLPSRVRSNRLDATIALIDRPNINESLVAMRKATEMMGKHGLAWGVVFAQQNSSKEKSNDHGYNYGHAGRNTDRYSSGYGTWYECDNSDDEDWGGEEWLKEAATKAYNAYHENYRENQSRSNKEENINNSEEDSSFTYESNVEKAYKTYDSEYERILSDRISFEMEHREEQEKILAQLHALIIKVDKARERFEERQEKAVKDLQIALKKAKAKTKA